MAHISGLVAAHVVPSPFESADVVSSTTHKSLRGPRAGMIFYRKACRQVVKENSKSGDKWINPRLINAEERINSAVFPSLQGGPHMNAIAAIAVMANEAKSNEYIDYATQVLKNAQALVNSLKALNYSIVSGGTDCHLLLVDLRPNGIDGARVEWVCEQSGIVANKNTVPGDKSAMNPGGLRLGTPGLTSRNLKESDFQIVAGFIDKAVQIAKRAKDKTKNLKEFKQFTLSDPDIVAATSQLRKNVDEFISVFPMPGWNDY